MSVDPSAHMITILNAIGVLCTNPNITDTLWMPGKNTPTVVESLYGVAQDLGATDEQLEQACKGYEFTEDGHGRPSGEA